MPDQLEKERNRLLKRIEDLLEAPMIFLGFAWFVLLIIEFINGLPKVWEYVSTTIWIIFIFDFLLKFFLAPAKLVYLRQNVLTALSLIIPAIRIFRVVRVIKLLRGLRGIQVIRVVSSLNRSMRSLSKTMSRRGFLYVVILTLVVIFGGAAGMLAIERGNAGFTSYGLSLWWTAMRVITAGSEYNPITPEGRFLAFIIAIYGYAVFGYVTATIASFFIGQDAEEADAPVAGAKEVAALQAQVNELTELVKEMNAKLPAR
ncbi:ion transporter [Aridibaculum aurantiacum]|uniref:ion transporter n=1 Tax=Aridibaculum aurantiacum TaxID=2810307 RepID=UPI001A95FD47|nr:ion transporter [Aridibaculum aurantiacum]